MIRSKKFLLLVIAISLFSSLYCQDTQTSSSFPYFGSDDSGTGDGGSTGGSGDGGTGGTPDMSKYYIEPAGDDSCSSCPGQLTATQKDSINGELSKNSILDAKIDLNVRVTVPLSANPYSEGDTDLWATVIRPSGSEKLPTIVVATPYRREIMMMLYVPLVSSRYNLMAIDIRGTGSSSGKWTSFDLVEQYDMKYLVDTFIPTRVWSDGKVGMIGPSYMGIIQLLTGGLVDNDPKTGEPVHLKALFPLVPMADTYRDIVMHGGNCDMLFIPLWLGMVDLMGILPSMLNLGVDGKWTDEDLKQAQAMWTEHLNNIPTTIGWIMDANNLKRGPFYDKKSTMIYWPVKPNGGWGFSEGDRVMSSKLPVFGVGGWFDIFTRGTTNMYQYGLSKHATSDKRMIIGEYYHLGGSMGMGLNSIMGGKLPARWFDWKIKKKADPFLEDFPVMLYVMGDNKWRAEKSWPLPESRLDHKTLYLNKHTPSSISGDWYTDEPWYVLIKNYTDNNYGLSEYQDTSGDNPVLRHNPLDLHGLVSRSSTRWLMGMEAIIADISKFYLGKNIDSSMWYDDERSDEKDCLTFTTEPLSEDVNITGPIALTFWAKTRFADPLTQSVINGLIDTIKSTLGITDNLLLDGMNKRDVQWVAELNDVFPNGRARNITSGWLSAWHRQYDPSGRTTSYTDGPWYWPTKVVEHPQDPAYTPFDPFYMGPDRSPMTINDGEVYQYTVELWPTCNTFKAGHRMRLSISASDFPHLLPIIQPSENTIMIDSRHTAKIDFTVTNDSNEGDSWEWIGSNADADKYLLSGGATGCGSAASAASYRGTAAGMAAEVMGLMGIMMLPLSLIMIRRYIRRRRKA
jgi:uncharacterized protein